MQPWHGAIIAILLFLIFLNLISRENTTPQAHHQVEGEIADGAIIQINEKNYPEIYKKWGETGVSKINALIKPAAENIVKSENCNKLLNIDLSPSRSTPPETIVYFADCENGKRFYVSNKDLELNKSASAADEKEIPTAVAHENCVSEIKKNLTFPSSYRENWGGVAMKRGATGNIIVTIDYEIKNDFGNIIPQQAKCVIPDHGAPELTILNR